MTEVAGGGSVVFSGRLSPAVQPWLADHAVNGTVLLPGTGLLELVLRAGGEVGWPLVRELTLQAPLVLPVEGGVQVQVVVGAQEESGGRAVSIHSRPEDDPMAPWTGHAEGLLGAEPLPVAGFELAQWPPVDAVAVEVGDAYEVLLGMGYEYGPVFQGLRALWRRGEEVFAEVALPEQAHGDAARFGVHPALLDAVLHAPLVVGDGQTVLPFSWAGVCLYSAGATEVRARIARVRENTVALTIADSTGAPVVSIEALAARPISADQLTTAHRTDSL
ncbi:polyketide synthase dehydratase domain-containing protein, partial [Streptosporangium sp. LJ11]|uniref:polyketide synthase dehydratase domain-containing protein n=1 Tax=Streptosporangium sp. LJ11 TaxID=3436927 RepID=UPI003F7B08E6